MFCYGIFQCQVRAVSEKVYSVAVASLAFKDGGGFTLLVSMQQRRQTRSCRSLCFGASSTVRVLASDASVIFILLPAGWCVSVENSQKDAHSC